MEELNPKFVNDDVVYIKNDSPEDSEEKPKEDINSVVEKLKGEISAKEQDGSAGPARELSDKDYSDLLSSLETMQKSFKSDIEEEVQSILAEEIKKAKQELVAENRKAIAQIVEHQKSLIQEMVGAEKKAIWDNVERLKESLTRKYSEELGLKEK